MARFEKNFDNYISEDAMNIGIVALNRKLQPTADLLTIR